MKHNYRTTILIITIVILMLILVSPQQTPASAQINVVRAVLFYSPTCPQCHEVINNVLPPLVEKYPNQLQIIGIDVTQEAGQTLYQQTLAKFNIPDERIGVPTMVIGNTVLVGANEIPEQLPAEIQQGLEQGGINWPDIPGLDQALQQTGFNPDNQTVSTEKPQTTTNPDITVIDKFMLDPVANSIAVVLLIVMLICVIVVGHRFLTGNPGKRSWPTWVLPTLALIGLLIAIYMTYIEFTHTEAICGPVGNCNSVQTSRYAYLFDTIPVGVMGAVGYAAILIAWLIQKFGPRSLNKVSKLAIWGMAWFGILFSIYLTFLEPFVIGATCAWCIGSASVMTLILWVSTGPALETMESSEIDYMDEDFDLDRDEDFVSSDR